MAIDVRQLRPSMRNTIVDAGQQAFWLTGTGTCANQ